MLLPDQRNGLIAYITARMELDVDAERRGIAATDADSVAAAEWDWVKWGRQQRLAIRQLVATIRTLDPDTAQRLLIGVATIWEKHPPLVDQQRGLPYIANGGGLAYVTSCCQVVATNAEGDLCCSCCYQDVDEVLAALPITSTVDTPWRGTPAAAEGAGHGQ